MWFCASLDFVSRAALNKMQFIHNEKFCLLLSYIITVLIKNILLGI